MFMFIGVEDRLMYSVVSLGITGLVALLVTANKITGSVALITGDFSSMYPSVNYVLPIIFSVGYAISVLK